MEMNDGAIQQRIEDLETRLQAQAREIRALEKLESLLERSGELERENRALREQVAELRTGGSLSRALGTTLNPEELLRGSLHLIGRALQVEAAAVLLLEEGRRLALKAAVGLPAALAPDWSLPPGEGLAGRVAATGEPCLVPDLDAEPGGREATAFGWRRGALLGVPLRGAGREVRGVLAAHRGDPGAFTPADLTRFQAVATQVAAALANAQLYQRTKELSARDELTGLSNRRAFFEQLEQEVQRARRYRRPFGLLMLDLDAFKAYNDTHGHLQGDAALRALAQLLGACTRRADGLARYGGEEFVLLLPEVGKPGGAVVAEKIRAAVAAHPFAGGRLTITLGLAAFPADAEDGLALLDVADRALYLGKQQGGNRVAVAPDAVAIPSPAR